MDTLSINIQITFADFFDFQKNQLKKRIVPLLFFAFSVIFINLYFIVSGDMNAIDVSTYYYPLLIFILLPVFLISTVYFGAKKTYNNDVFGRKEHTYTFSNESLLVVSDSSIINLNWKDAYNYMVTKQSIIIYLSPQKAFIIPKRLFKYNEENFILYILQSEVKQKKDRILLIRLGFYIIAVIILLYTWGVFSSTPIDHYEEGVKAEHEGKYNLAIEEFDRVIAENPNFVAAYVYRGYAKSGLNNSQGYLDDCNKAIEIDKNFANAYTHRAIASARMGDSTNSCSDIQHAISLGDKQAEEIKAEYCKQKK